MGIRHAGGGIDRAEQMFDTLRVPGGDVRFIGRGGRTAEGAMGGTITFRPRGTRAGKSGGASGARIEFSGAPTGFGDGVKKVIFMELTCPNTDASCLTRL